jgi:hypothetical protein
MIVRFTFDPDGPNRFHDVSDADFEILKLAQAEFGYLNRIPDDHPANKVWIRTVNSPQVSLKFPTLIGYQ